jgi:hypothetical protein
LACSELAALSLPLRRQSNQVAQLDCPGAEKRRYQKSVFHSELLFISFLSLPIPFATQAKSKGKSF